MTQSVRSLLVVVASLLGTGTFLPDNAWSAEMISARSLRTPNEARIRELVKQLGQSKEYEGDEPSIALREFGNESVPFLFEALLNGSTSDAGRSNLIYFMLQISRRSETIAPYMPQLMRLMDDSYGRVRYLAVHMLSDYYPKSYPAIRNAYPRVIVAIEDSDRDVRGAATYFFARNGDDQPAVDAVPALVRALLKDEYYGVRSNAAYALGTIARKPELSVPALIDALKDKDLSVRDWSLRSLAKFPKQAKQIVPHLIDLIQAGDESRQDAIRTLGEYGVEAAPAVAVLEKRLYDDQDLNVRGDSAHTIGKIGKAGVEALLRATAVADDETRWIATEGLGDLGPIDARILTRISELLKDKFNLARTAAIRATMGMGAKAPMFLERLDWIAKNDKYAGFEAKMAAAEIRRRMRK